MAEETKEQENATGLNDSESVAPEESTTSVDGDPGGGEGDAFDASSYEESFGLPAGTLDGVGNAESALESIREYTDKTLTAGLLSDAKIDPAVVVDETPPVGAAETPAATGKLATSKNLELDALRADLAEVKEKLVTRENNDHNAQVVEINRRVDSEIDDWASPKYGTSKSRNFNQAKSVKELQELVQTHIAGSQAQGKAPPIVEQLLRQVRTFHDDEYKPSPVKKNGEAVLGSPGTGSRSTKGDDGPKNIHEALMGNSY